MISLDQIQLLEAKIESAVGKIQQLQVENDALRNRVQELSNALSAKSEQLSLVEQKVSEREMEISNRAREQEMIESGILKALNRLNSIENTVLKTVNQEPAAPQVQAVQPEPVAVPAAAQEIESETIPEETIPEQAYIETEAEPALEDSMDIIDEMPSEELPNEIEIPADMTSEDSFEPEMTETSPFDNNKSDIPGFDIF